MLKKIDSLIEARLVRPLIEYHRQKTGDSRFRLVLIFFHSSLLLVLFGLLTLLVARAVDDITLILVCIGFLILLRWPLRDLLMLIDKFDRDEKRGIPRMTNPMFSDYRDRLLFVSGGLVGFLAAIVLTFLQSVLLFGLIFPALGFWSFVLGYYVLTLPSPPFKKLESKEYHHQSQSLLA